MCSEYLGGAGDGTCIAHIGDTVEYHEQGYFALIEDGGDQVLNIVKMHGRDQCHDSLMVGPDHFVELDAGYEAQRHVGCLAQPAQVLFQFAARTLLEEYFTQFAPFLQGFKNGIPSIDDFRHAIRGFSSESK